MKIDLRIAGSGNIARYRLNIDGIWLTELGRAVCVAVLIAAATQMADIGLITQIQT